MKILFLGDAVGIPGRSLILNNLLSEIKNKKIDKVPVNKYDQKLDYIVTNKYTVGK